MVGISGKKERSVELVKHAGYEFVIFGGWENWKKYFMDTMAPVFIDGVTGDYVIDLVPEKQWQWKQNYPELVVKDVVANFSNRLGSEKGVEHLTYPILLYRGINKWLFVRYLLVRYKKMVADWRNKAYEEFVGFKKMYDAAWPERHKMYADDWGKVNYRMGYWEGYYDAMRKVRADLKTLCNTPRFVVWNGSRPGFVVDKKISRGWLRLVEDLYKIRFEK